ncbi:MAG: hypothetical protein ACXWPP_05500 [Ktedonobacteraceae bacterium]
MCDWHIEPDRRFKVTYRDRFFYTEAGERKEQIFTLHVLANSPIEARELTQELVEEIISIEEE